MHFIHHSHTSSTSSVGSSKALLLLFLTAINAQTHFYFSALPLHPHRFSSSSALSPASNSDCACIFSTLTIQTNTLHTLPLHSATLLRTNSRLMQDQNEDEDKNKRRMETRIVWNNNESHFTLSAAQNNDSIHHLNRKSSFTENRKRTQPNFTLLSSRQYSPRSTNTSFIPHSYLFQSFSSADSQSIIPFLRCLRSSNLSCFQPLLYDLFRFFFHLSLASILLHLYISL